MTGRISFSIFVSLWLLGVSVLVYVYSSTVITSLTVPKLNPPINSFEDLLRSGDVSVLLRTDLYWGLRILVFVFMSLKRHLLNGLKILLQNSKAGILKQLAVKAQNQPESLTNDPIELDKRLATGKFAYPFVIFLNSILFKWPSITICHRQRLSFEYSLPISSKKMGNADFKSLTSFKRPICSTSPWYRNPVKSGDH